MCAPCRKELPVIEKLQREFGEHGLVVLAITSEAKKIAAAFIEKHKYSFPVLIDIDGGVFDEYQVSSIPVVFVVDRKGRIADHYVGLRDENELVDAMRRAGIKQ
ncbi:MAG: TlpA family protein disulfide reductase [Candidatus Krumholzibacteria bacterium]|nr:TlpA family protein disulfide reductase [Candidatus Krumholzibacteria bacterium]